MIDIIKINTIEELSTLHCMRRKRIKGSEDSGVHIFSRITKRKLFLGYKFKAQLQSKTA